MKLKLDFGNEQPSQVIENVAGGIVLERALVTQIFYRVTGDVKTRMVCCSSKDTYEFLEGVN